MHEHELYRQEVVQDGGVVPPGNPCPECEGRGWLVVERTEPRCCGLAQFECGGAGCQGPEPEAVEEQVGCSTCYGFGAIK